MVWDGQTTISSSTTTLMDTEDGNNGNLILANFAGNSYFRINTISGTGINGTFGAPGMFVANRSSSTNTQGYNNGSGTPVVTSTSDTSQPLDSANFAIPGYISPSTDLIRAASFGSSLNSTDVVNLYGRLSTFITTIHGSVP